MGVPGGVVALEGCNRSAAVGDDAEKQEFRDLAVLAFPCATGVEIVRMTDEATSNECCGRRRQNWKLTALARVTRASWDSPSMVHLILMKEISSGRVDRSAGSPIAISLLFEFRNATGSRTSTWRMLWRIDLEAIWDA